MREAGPGAEAEALGQPPPLGRHGAETVEEDPRGEGEVEEDVREQNAGQPVDVEPRQADGREAVRDPAGAPPDRRDAEGRADHRQQERRAEQQHRRLAPRKAPARERQRQRRAAGDRERGRERGLEEGELDRPPVRTGEAGPAAAATQPRRRRRAERRRQRQRQRRAAREEGEGGRGRASEAGPPAGGAHRLSASRKSAIASGRASRAASGESRSEVLGVTSVSKPSGRPPSGVTAGYIQFVVGIADWKGSDSMNSRNRPASSA